MEFKIGSAYVEVTTRDTADRDARRIEQRLNRIRGTAHVGVDVDDRGFTRARGSILSGSRDIQRSLASTASAGGAFARLGSMAATAAPNIGLVAGAAVLAGAAIAALPATVMAATGAIGVLGLAFRGVGDALTGYKADQDAAGKSAATTAATARSNARAIRDALSSIDDARRNQARVARQGAEQIAAAEERVTSSLDDEKRAQADLTTARKDAARQLDDLREKVHDLALDEEGATLAVREAQIRQATTNKDVFSSSIQREQAAYDLKTAEERLRDIQRERSQSTADLADAEKKGVDGSATVVAAQERVADAHKSTEDAQVQLQRTERDAREANQDAARSSADAIQRLSDVQAQQGETATVAAAGSSKFAAAMAELTAPAQAFVMQLLAMKPLLDRLTATAAAAFLPGLTQMLKDSVSLFPIVNGFIRDAGTIMGDTARQFGQLFKSSEFQKNLQATMEASLPIIKAVGDALVMLTSAWFKLGAGSGPAAAGVASLIDSIATGLSGFLAALGPGMGAFGTILTMVGQLVGGLLPPLGVLVTALSQMLAPALAVLVPIVVRVVSMLADALAPVLVDLAPLLAMVAQVVGQLGLAVAAILVQALDALKPYLPIIVQNMIDMLRAITPLIPIVAGFAGQLIGALVPYLPQLIGLGTQFIQQALIPMIPPLLQLIQKCLPPLISLLQWLAPLVVDVGRRFIDNVVNIVNKYVIPTLDFLNRAVDGVGRMFSNTVDWIGRSWDSIREKARSPVQWVVDVVYNNGVRPVWNGIASVFGMPQLSEVRLARGGLVPGVDRGYDYVPALLRGGEGVLVPEAVNALGGAAGIHSLNRAAERQHFAAGGVAGARTSGSASITSAMGSAQAVSPASSFMSDVLGDAGGAVRKLFGGVLGDAGRTPGSGMLRDALVKIPQMVLDKVIEKAKALANTMAASGGAALGSFGGNRLTYAKEIVRAARDRGLGASGAIIGLATALVESAMRMYANTAVPASLGYPHDAVGHDHDSVGLFQQRQAGWGTLAQRMNPYASAGLFFNKLMTFNWRAMSPGAAAQRVQVSAFPGRYAQQMGAASSLLGLAGGYDLGGVANGVGMLPKYTPEPERVLSPDQTRAFERLVDHLTAGGGAYGDRPVQVVVQQTSGSPAETGRFVALALRSA